MDHREVVSGPTGLRWGLTASVLVAFLLAAMSARVAAASSPEPEVDYSGFNPDGVRSENCNMSECYMKVSYCWFHAKCICDDGDTECTAQCAMCLDEHWFTCCACTGLCAMDARAKSAKLHLFVTLDKDDFMPTEYFVGGFTKRNRNHDKFLLETTAAAVQTMVKADIDRDPRERTVSLGRLGVSIRNNTLPKPSATAPDATGSAGTASTSASTAAPTTGNATGAAAAGSERRGAVADMMQNMTVFGNISAVFHSEEVKKLEERLTRYHATCAHNQCVTIYSKMAVNRPVCWQICDALGAKTWHHWATDSCECRSRCCRNPEGHLRPLFQEVQS